MVVHPRTLKDYRRAQMQRSLADEIDARVICDYARRTPFQPWQPPDEEVFELRALTRRMQVLTQERTRELCRRHTAEKSNRGSAYVLNDIDVNVRHLERRIQRPAPRAAHPANRRRGAQTGPPARPSNSCDASPDFGAWHRRQERRHDPWRTAGDARRPRRARVGRLRRALYMPALVASRNEPHVRAFYEKLTGKGKKPLVALVAVMRKLLHAIYGMPWTRPGLRWLKILPDGAANRLTSKRVFNSIQFWIAPL